MGSLAGSGSFVIHGGFLPKGMAWVPEVSLIGDQPLISLPRTDRMLSKLCGMDLAHNKFLDEMTELRNEACSQAEQKYLAEQDPMGSVQGQRQSDLRQRRSGLRRAQTLPVHVPVDVGSFQADETAPASSLLSGWTARRWCASSSRLQRCSSWCALAARTP